MSKATTEPETTFEAETLPGVAYISREEGVRLLDERARAYLGISGEEFVRRYYAGEIDDPDRSDVIMLAMMIEWTEP
jgi:hypothetical protein